MILLLLQSKQIHKKKLGFSGGHFNVRYLVTLANTTKYNGLEFLLHFLTVFSISPFSDLLKLQLLEILLRVSIRQVSLAFLFG